MLKFILFVWPYLLTFRKVYIFTSSLQSSPAFSPVYGFPLASEASVNRQFLYLKLHVDVLLRKKLSFKSAVAVGDVEIPPGVGTMLTCKPLVTLNIDRGSFDHH